MRFQILFVGFEKSGWPKKTPLIIRKNREKGGGFSVIGYDFENLTLNPPSTWTPPKVQF